MRASIGQHFLETLLTPQQWGALVRLNVRLGTDTVEPIPDYGDLEMLGYGKDNIVMRQTAATTPLRPMPLAVLAHGRPFAVPEKPEGFSSDRLESVLRAANENLATLVPKARFFVHFGTLKRPSSAFCFGPALRTDGHSDSGSARSGGARWSGE